MKRSTIPRWPAITAGDLEASVRAAARALSAGEVALLPTESSHALAADARSDEAVARVRAIKGGRDGKPLLLLAADVEQARTLARLDGPAERLAVAWPAPLTLVVAPRDVALARRLGGASVAVRVPAAPATLAVLARLGAPVTGTSANGAGAPPVLDARGADEAFAQGGVAGILDVGRLPGGPPSTLVEISGDRARVLRLGAFPAARLEELWGGSLGYDESMTRGASEKPPYLGLVGPNSSGKGVTAEYLSERHGYRVHSLSDVVREEARARGLQPVRGTLIEIGNELRRKHGPAVLAERVLSVIEPPALVDSIRAPAEVEALRRLPRFVLLAVDASVNVRFRRSLVRQRPGDPATLEEFLAREEQENTRDPDAQQVRATARLADHVVRNDGTLEDLHAALDALVAKLSAAEAGPRTAS